MANTVNALTSAGNKGNLLYRIFAYHGYDKTDEDLKSIWREDLLEFTAEEIERAWDEWRKSDVNVNKRPRSYDLVRLIKAHRRPGPPMREYNSTDERRPADTEEMARNLRIMRRNNPNILRDIATAKSGAEKILVGLQALGKPELLNSPIAQALTKKLEQHYVK
jgi:hypothetical protein